VQFQITVIQINEVTGKKNNRGGVYDQIEVVYKREGKVEAKAFPEFANKEIYETLKGLEKDGTYTVITEKVGEFWKWLSVAPTNGAEGTQTSVGTTMSNQPTQPASPSSKSTGKVIGSNYETPSERALRQKLIVAQSSLSNAVALLSAEFPKGIPEGEGGRVEVYTTRFYNLVFDLVTRDLSDIKSDEV